MVSAKTIFAYLLYALLTVLVFLYLLFPEQAVKAYVDAKLAAIDPSLTMEAASIRPTIPPGLKMTDVDLERGTVKVAHLDDARMTANLMTLFKEEKQGRFEAHLADGTISGTAYMTGSGPGAQLRTEADLTQIRLESLDAVKEFNRFSLSGVMSGRITNQGPSGAIGALSGTLTASPLRIALKAPILGIGELVMDQTNAEFSINRQSLRLKALTFEGPMLEGRINGTIDLRRPLEKSRLNLSGNVKPRPELVARLQETVPTEAINPSVLGTRGMTFRVRGTIDSPDVSMR